MALFDLRQALTTASQLHFSMLYQKESVLQIPTGHCFTGLLSNSHDGPRTADAGNHSQCASQDAATETRHARSYAQGAQHALDLLHHLAAFPIDSLKRITKSTVFNQPPQVIANCPGTEFRQQRQPQLPTKCLTSLTVQVCP